MMRPHSTGKFWISMIALLVTTSGLQGVNRILIKTVASEEYVKQRATDEKKKIQTYNFFEGHFFPGSVKDRSLERFAFMDIVGDMAVHLKKQGYYNHPVMGEGDLLIVVHYGSTDYEVDFLDLMGFTSLEDVTYTEDMGGSGLADFVNVVSVMDIMGSFENSNDQSRIGKSRILGMEEAYMKGTARWKREQLDKMLKESRYLVILMAYDYPLLKQGEAKLLWSTRYSIRAAGQSFDQAIKDMNLVASDYFGKDLEGLNETRVTDKSRVEMGEIEVIEQAPE